MNSSACLRAQFSPSSSRLKWNLLLSFLLSKHINTDANKGSPSQWISCLPLSGRETKALPANWVLERLWDSSVCKKNIYGLRSWQQGNISSLTSQGLKAFCELNPPKVSTVNGLIEFLGGKLLMKLMWFCFQSPTLYAWVSLMILRGEPQKKVNEDCFKIVSSLRMWA